MAQESTFTKLATTASPDYLSSSSSPTISPIPIYKEGFPYF